MNQNFQNMQNTSLSHKCATAHLAESRGCGFRTLPINVLKVLLVFVDFKSLNIK